MVSLFGWPTLARAARPAQPRRRAGFGPVLAGAVLLGLLSGCAAPLTTIGGTDPAAGGFTGLGGPAATGLPGGAPGAGPDTGARFGSRFGPGTATGDGDASAPPSRVPSPAPVPPAAVPEVPRQSTSLSSLAAPVSAPVRVRAASIGIDMSIEAVGLGEGSAMALPANPAVAAWYRYGPGPGSPAGATVVAAHVDSLAYDIGPFAQLADAPVGTEILVDTADGATHRYTVASVDSIEKPTVPWASVFDRTGQPRLTLVTCGGEFDYEARRYLSNVIVTAVPAP
ncbi:class F sortase [Cryobacterium lactosi]|nr:class F sortase [Cryobacterium lactosi]